MPKNSIHVQTEDQRSYKKDKKITTKQWKIYYYLLSISKYNSQDVENHRYVYKKNLNISACCRFLGVKSTKTFYNAIERLRQCHLVLERDNEYLLYTTNWIDINQNVLKTMVEYSAGEDKESHIDLLRTYLILKKMNKVAENKEERSFTRRQLIILLGHNDNTSELYDQVTIYLALLNFWGFIKIKKFTTYDESIGKYTTFILQDVIDVPDSDFELDMKAESQTKLPSKALMDKLRFSESAILDD